MCSGSSSSSGRAGRSDSSSASTVVGYEIIRIDSHEVAVRHVPSRSGIELHNLSAPIPSVAGGPRSKRYSKRYKDREKHYPLGKQLYEYPDIAGYPYGPIVNGTGQNSRGQAYRTSPQGTVRNVDAGYVRTITDEGKRIQGVSYHPRASDPYHERAKEIRGPRRRR